MAYIWVYLCFLNISVSKAWDCDSYKQIKSGNYGDLSPTRSQSSLCCEENYFLDVLILYYTIILIL